MSALEGQPLPWQQSAWEQLQQARQTSRLPHALLIHGPSGIGKSLFARRLAVALLCHNTTHGDACGDCQGCRLVRAGHHPDMLWLQPEAPGKPIKVDQIRQLNTFVARTTEFGGARLVCLEAAEQMNINAANSLLKTLEEPTPGSLLMLLATHPTRLSATIRSRCQRLALPRPEPRSVQAWLAAQLGNQQDATLLLQRARGAPLAALALADETALTRRQQLFEGFRTLVLGREDPLALAARCLEAQPGENLRWLLDWHMDLIRLKMSAEPAGLTNPDLHGGLLELARGLSLEVLFSRLDAVRRLYALTATPASMPLQMEAFWMSYPRIPGQHLGG